jgi:hypothetical protein
VRFHLNPHARCCRILADRDILEFQAFRAGQYNGHRDNGALRSFDGWHHFLVLELDGSFGGQIQLSSAPLHHALEHLGK